MKRVYLYGAIVLALTVLAFTYPTEKLMDPAVLAKILNSQSADKPLIINVGPSGPIKTSTLIGNAEDPANKAKLQALLKTLPKDKKIVIYCGCCKLGECWNISEANKVLAAAGFTNYQILNLETDFTLDWINKGYPMQY
jgi:thiosulfate/3-mercaptopyruvate sulfurtransferase